MAVTEDVARLILEADTKGFTDAQAKIASTQAALAKLTADYKSGAIGIDEYMKEGGQLQASLDDIKAAYQFAGEAAKKYGSNAAAAAALADQSLKATSQRAQAAARGVLELSRGVEDFATGGPIGLLNNIPGIFQSIGTTAGLSTAAIGGLTAGVSLAATGAYILYRNWDSVIGVFEDRNAIPGATTELGRHEEALKKVSKALDEMKEKTSLNYEETKKFKELQQEQADLEEKLAQDRKNKANEQAHGEHASQAEKDVASGFAKALDEAGGYRKVVDRFTDQLASQLKATEEEIPSLRKAIEDQFSAALGGDIKARNTIRDTAAKDTTGKTGMFDTFIDMYSPETKVAEEKAKQSRDLIAEFEDQALGDKALKEQNDAKKKADAERIRQANAEAQDLENNPEVQAEGARNRRLFGDFRAGGADPREAAAEAKRHAREVDQGRKSDARPLNMEAYNAALETQQIVRQNLGISLQAANQIQQMRARNRQLAEEAARIRRFMGAPGPSNLNMGFGG